MLAAAKMKANATAKEGSHRGSSQRFLPLPSQTGSILIGLIVTMVVMAFLGAGMIYLTTTSTYSGLFFNRHMNASSVAESGGRHALSVIRDAYANDKTRLNAINANQVFTLSDGSTFQIANWNQNGANPETVTFTSIGTVGSGFLQAKREIRFSIQPSNQSGGSNNSGQGEYIIDLPALANNEITGSMDFATVNVNGNQAVEVIKDQGSGVNAEAYVFAPAGDPNPFYVNWVASGDFSNYDVQVKVATGTLSGGSLSETKPTTYANGLIFRGTTLTGQRQDFLSVSLVRNTMLSENVEPSSWTTWASGTPYVAGNIVKYTNGNYYQCKLAPPSPYTVLPTNTTYWTTFAQDTAMIMLWVRGSNHANGDGNWVAYKMLDQTGKNYVVDGQGRTKDWSTLLVRVVEAASIKLSVMSAPTVDVGDTVTGLGGTGTAKVFRKISDNDGYVVLLLNNIYGTFSRPATVGAYATDPTWGYRSRDNYIWTFYTDTDNHTANTTPLETAGTYDNRLGQVRGTINWPITDLQSWADVNDKFSLVTWDNLNTGEDPDIRVMGAGKEAGAIIRSDITSPQTTRPGPYTNATFPGEIGLVSLGGENDAFFDDLAFYMTGGTTGGSEGSGSVIQYP
jgi:Tfp pilus assembly protein PilX